MVSLGNDAGVSGTFSFLGEEAAEDSISRRLLSSEEEPKFRRVPTVWVAIVQLIILVAVEVLLFILPWQCTGVECESRVFCIYLYIQVSIWSIMLIVDQYLRCQHRVLRRGGYLNFYRQTQKMRRSTLYIFSAGGSVILLTIAFLDTTCADYNKCPENILLSPVNYLQILMSIEVVISMLFIIIYLVQAVQFNMQRPLPDVEDDFPSVEIPFRAPVTQIGYRDEDTLDDVVEKQADVIRYLKIHNANLGRKVMLLTSQLNALRSV